MKLMNVLAMWGLFILLASGSCSVRTSESDITGSTSTEGCEAGWGVYDVNTDICWQDPSGETEVDWYDAANYCESLEHGGYNDWTLPGREDFLDILDGCDNNVQIGLEGFCNPCSENETCSTLFGVQENDDEVCFWTTTPFGMLAWLVCVSESGFYANPVDDEDWYYGEDYYYGYARCIRRHVKGGEEAEAAEFSEECDPAWGSYDASTRTCWQSQSTETDWPDHCESLALGGYEDWILPSRQDLVDLLGGCDDDVVAGKTGWCNQCSKSETCNALFGPDLETYWSLTPYDDGCDLGVHNEWLTSFETGIVDLLSNIENSETERHMRCIRRVKP